MKTKLASVAFFCLSLSLTNSAALSQQAPVASGNEMADICASDDMAQQGYCLGYVVGMIEGMKWGVALPLLQDGLSAKEINPLTEVVLGFCLPEGATYGQYIDVFRSYLAQHPETRHFSARILAQQAFIEAFPCQE